MAHPDSIWQSTEVAYSIVYGDQTNKGEFKLPWEWQQEFKLRSTIYPYFIALPLFVLKWTGLDSNYMVRQMPYIQQCIILCISDSYLWNIGKKTVGNSSTRIAFIIYLSNRVQNEIIIRCFTNGFEQIMSVIAFSYYLQLKNKFNASAVIFTALITISFMIRNTSPIGWIPLLFLKVIKEGSFFPLLISLITVAFPLMALCIYCDSIYYSKSGCFDSGEITLTSLNFLKVNVYQGLSKYFGDEPFYSYIAAWMPLVFLVMYPFVFPAIYLYTKETYSNKKQQPYLTYFVAFYLLIFSLIKHKELRFLIPILPFCFLILGYFFFRKAKQFILWIKIIIIFNIVLNTLIIAVLH